MFEPPNSYAPVPVAPRRTGLLVAIVVLAVAPSARAANASACQRNSPGEQTQSQILEYLYGVPSGQANHTSLNGSVGVKLIDDDAAAERTFQGELGSARTQDSNDWNGDEPRALLTAGVNNVGPAADVTGRGLRNAVLALRSRGPVGESSDAADPLNAGVVTGDVVHGRSFLLFWEDAASLQPEFNYNDLVVDVAGGPNSGRATANVLIPLPAAAWTGFSVMGGVSLMAALRKVRKRLS